MAFSTKHIGKLVWKSPSTRALLSLSLAMLLSTLFASTAVLLNLRQREITHAKSTIVSLSRVLSEQTTRTFQSVALTMRSAQERLSDDIGSSVELNSTPVHFLLKARAAGLPQVKSLFVIDKNGLGVNSSRPDFIRQLPMSERRFFSHFINQGGDEIFISAPEKASVDGQLAFYISVRLTDKKGQFRGVLAASINIDYFESLYKSIGLDIASRIQLINQDGILLAGNLHNEKNIGNPIISTSTFSTLGDNPKDFVVKIDTDPSDNRHLTAYRKVANYPLMMAVSITEEEALAPWHHFLRPAATGVALALLIVLTTTFLMMRNLVRKSILELALKESDAHLRHMVQSVGDAILVVNSTNHIVLFNSAAEQLFGLKANEAIGTEMSDLLSRCLPQPQRGTLLRHLEEGRHSTAGLSTLSIVELIKNNKTFPVEMSLSTAVFRDESLLTATFRDLSERQRTERELFESKRQLQELSASQQNVREEERTRIARELHDELGQSLTGIRMEISWLGGRLNTEQQDLSNKIFLIKNLIDQTITSVRRISSELRPLVLDDLGFAAAATWYIDQFSVRTGLHVTTTLAEQDPEHGGAVATALFRILQESLTNISRHARATTVDIQLHFDLDKWTLSIRDNGMGFEKTTGKVEGIGVIGMRERVHILGGEFSITTAPGKGTLVEIAIPAETMPQGEMNEAF